MAGIKEYFKLTAIALTAGSAVYSTFLLHRVVEDGRWVHVISPQDTGRLPREPILVRIVDDQPPISVSGHVSLSDRTAIRVQQIGPVDVGGPVEIFARTPVSVTTPISRPLDVRLAR
jgi:hypothetical protein